jgi:hypothetical protein
MTTSVLGAFAMYAAKTILTTLWIIFIGIPSNMADYNALSTGRIQVFIDLWSGVFID